MTQGTAIIAKIKDADSANAVMAEFKAVPHALTSKKELSTLWNDKIKECGLVFSKENGAYEPVPKEPENPAEVQ